MEVKRDILWRVYLSFIGMVLVGACILARAIYIQQVEGSYWRSKSDSLYQKFVDLEPDRGTIYSADGSMLSTSIPYFDIYIDFAAEGLRDENGARFRRHVDSLSVLFAGLFQDRSATQYKSMLLQGYRKKKRYFLLKKDLTFHQFKTMRSFPLVREGRNKSGFIAEVKSRRLNPFGLLANRTIGLARLNSQNVGLERTYDSLLKGESGGKLVRFIAGGVAVPVEGSEIDPQHGKDVVTTLDVNMQDIAEQALHRMMVENECAYGTCIVMEVATGKIKAIANLGRQPDGSYWEDLNYAIRASEPGSTFKLATLLAVLEDEHVTIEDRINLEGGSWKVRGRTVFDSEKHGLYDVSVKTAFEHSSNVGMAKLAMQFYAENPEQFIDHLKQLHLHEYSGVGLVGESRPVIKNPSSRTWSKTTVPWMAFGYEVLVSPLQTLMLYNAVANDGVMMKPRLVQAIMQDGVIVSAESPEVVEDRICSEVTLKQLKQVLEGVVTDGTGKSLQNPYYRIAGKTGTALVANGKRGYADHIYQSSFAGYFPADRPQYSCIVVIKNKPRAKKYYGAAVAGPVFKEVADKLMALHAARNEQPLGSPDGADSTGFYYAGETAELRLLLHHMNAGYVDSSQGSTWGSLYAHAFTPVVQQRAINGRSLPNVKGMGLKDALYVMEKLNLRVRIKGKGKVHMQLPEAGTMINPNQIITLELR